MPSTKYLSNILLSNRHDKICTDIICKLSKVSQICLTMDIWSNRQMHSFLGVTAHFINNFNLESVMLACCRFRGSHTGENILCQYEAITTSFNIHDKVRSVITDNAANMLKAITLLDLPPDMMKKMMRTSKKMNFSQFLRFHTRHWRQNTIRALPTQYSSLLLMALSKLNTSTVYWGKFQS